MIIRIKCKSCGRTFNTEILANNTIKRCTCCGKEFLMRSEALLDNIMTILFRNNKPMDDIKLLRVSFNDDDYIINDDFKNLYNVYASAECDTQRILSNIIDKLYLLCYHSVEENNLPELKEIENILQTQFKKRIEEKDSLFDEILALDNKESNNGQA